MDQEEYFRLLQAGINPDSVGNLPPDVRDRIVAALLAQREGGGDGGVVGGTFGAPSATGSVPGAPAPSAPPPSAPPPSAPPPTGTQTGKAGVEPPAPPPPAPQELTPQQIIDMEFEALGPSYAGSQQHFGETFGPFGGNQGQAEAAAQAAANQAANQGQAPIDFSGQNYGNPAAPPASQYGPAAIAGLPGQGFATNPEVSGVPFGGGFGVPASQGFPDVAAQQGPFGVPGNVGAMTYGAPGFGTPPYGETQSLATGVPMGASVPFGNTPYGAYAPNPDLPYGAYGLPHAALDDPYSAMASANPYGAAGPAGPPSGTPAAASYAGAGAFGSQGYAGDNPAGPFGGYDSPFDSDVAAGNAAAAAAGTAAGAAGYGDVGDAWGGGGYGDSYGDDSGDDDGDGDGDGDGGDGDD